MITKKGRNGKHAEAMRRERERQELWLSRQRMRQPIRPDTCPPAHADNLAASSKFAIMRKNGVLSVVEIGGVGAGVDHLLSTISDDARERYEWLLQEWHGAEDYAVTSCPTPTAAKELRRHIHELVRAGLIASAEFVEDGRIFHTVRFLRQQAA